MIRSTPPAAQDDDTTPMMRQYLTAKQRHPDELVLFRMGDFYELFYADAERAAELLGITLTARSKDRSGARIPMAGVPVKAVDGYVRRLLDLGERVAICEQMEDPREAQGIVEREVVRVITPGTFIESDGLDAARPLHLCALFQEGPQLGLAWVDLSTGRFQAEDFASGRHWEAALLRIEPAECLVVEGQPRGTLPAQAYLEAQLPRCALTPYPEWHFERATGRERLLAHFGTRTLEGFGCEHLGPALRAAGALIHYLRETQKQALPHITRLSPGTSHKRLRLDAATHRALDLVEVARTGQRRGSLLGHLDRTRTPLGARQLREWLTAPLTDRGEILARQDAVAFLIAEEARRAALREALRAVRDIERLSARLSMGRVNGRDLKALEQSLVAVPALKQPLAGVEAPVLAAVDRALPADRLTALADAISHAIVDDPPLTVKEGGLIRDGYDPDLDELRATAQAGVSWIARFQEQEVQRTGIPTLKVGYNRVFGYYIEITNAHQQKIPVDYTRKQTLKNAERYVTPGLKEQEQRVLGARERAEQLEFELFGRLREALQSELVLLQTAAEAIAQLDALQALAVVAVEEDATRPVVVEHPVLEIIDGRHPVVAAGLGRQEFTPNDIVMGDFSWRGAPTVAHDDTGVGDGHGLDARTASAEGSLHEGTSKKAGVPPVELPDDAPPGPGLLAVITGPNMAGKSTYIRQAALLTILAQMGAFVPARRAVIGIADRIFTRVGAADDLTRGQSTFMVEMTETANILNNATERSLVILDEVGRGTSTLDGISLAWAIAEHLIERIGARALFATHYHELTELEQHHGGRVQNLNVAVREWRDEIVFLHKIVRGSTDKAYGIHVARLAGIPDPVLRRARTLLRELEHHVPRSALAPISAAAAPGIQQLDLFQSPGEELARRLRAIDLDELTPRQALDILYELRRSLD